VPGCLLFYYCELDLPTASRPVAFEPFEQVVRLPALRAIEWIEIQMTKRTLNEIRDCYRIQPLAFHPFFRKKLIERAYYYIIQPGVLSIIKPASSPSSAGELYKKGPIPRFH
jgi:hypothetical protein